MKKILVLIIIGISFFPVYSMGGRSPEDKILFAKQMFHQVFTQLNAKSIRRYFTKNALIKLNFDKPMNRNDLIKRVLNLKRSVKTIHYKYDDFVVSGNKIVVRCLVSIRTLHGKVQHRKQMTMMKFNHNKISKIWELSLANNQLLERFN